MLSAKPDSRILALLLSLATFITPLAAQQKTPQGKIATPAGPKTANSSAVAEKPVAIDSLFSADAYKIYGELKNVGTLVTTGSIAELVDPVMKMADPPKAFKTLIKFIHANADTLSDSRLVLATWPARPGLPDVVVVLELATPDDAAKFEPKLKRVLPDIVPTPTPTPSPGPKADEDKGKAGTAEAGPQPKPVRTVAEPSTPVEEQKPSPPPFVVTRRGNLILVTDRPFKFEKLRPADSKLLTEDQNFRSAHERFTTEPVFVFVNLALQDFNRPAPSPTPSVDAAEEARKAAEAEAEARKNEAVEAATVQTEVVPDPPPPVVAYVPDEHVTLTAKVEAAPPPPPQATQVAMAAAGSLMGLLTGGPPEWPDAIGVALAQEADDYVIRAVLVNPQNSKHPLLPFMPNLVAGRSLPPNAPLILPDETEFLVSASVDFSKTYQEMQARLDETNREELERLHKASHSDPPASPTPNDPFHEIETKGHFKIRDELIPAFGNEIAVAGSLSAMQSGGFGFGMVLPEPNRNDSRNPEEAQAQKKRAEESSPVLVLSVKDREAARRLMPKLLDGLGVGMAKMIATPVRRDDTEMMDFAGAFAYAFVGDFLIISTTPTVRHIIDSYLNHQTLSSNTAYRNFTRWQPSGVVGQIYLSPALMERYQVAAHDPSPAISPAMREYLLRLNPTPQAISYSLSQEVYGSLHELHLPKAFVLASVAGAASVTNQTPAEMNESIAMGLLQMVANAEETYKSGEGKGNYTTLDKLISANLVQKDALDRYGYRFEVMVSGTHFEATAVPIEYGKTGRLSYFIDESGVLRGGDHGGGPASLSDKGLR